MTKDLIEKIEAPISLPVKYDAPAGAIRECDLGAVICEMRRFLTGEIRVAVSWNNQQGEYIALCINQHEALARENAELRKQVAEAEWFPVSQDTPFDGPYLCYIREPQECGNILFYQNVRQVINNEWKTGPIGEIIFWRFLPEPPATKEKL